MEQWSADERVLKSIESIWEKDGGLDTPWVNIQEEHMNIGQLYDLLIQSKLTELGQYVRTKFKSDQPLATKLYTCREIINEMRIGSPIGILAYTVVGSHIGCCNESPKELHQHKFQ